MSPRGKAESESQPKSQPMSGSVPDTGLIPERTPEPIPELNLTPEPTPESGPGLGPESEWTESERGETSKGLQGKKF